MTAAAGEAFEDLAREPAVRGHLHRAAGRDALALTHGAGSDAEHPLLVALGERFSVAGITVLRYDLPYRQSRRRGPPSPRAAATDRDGIRRAIDCLRESAPGRVFAGGQSYGGRQTSMVAAETSAIVDGLLLLSYPLHPPHRPGVMRTAHLGAIRAPVMFVHGATDPFGTLDEIEAARALVAAPTALLPIEGAGHDLKGARRTAAEVNALADRIVTAFVEWTSSR